MVAVCGTLYHSTTFNYSKWKVVVIKSNLEIFSSVTSNFLMVYLNADGCLFVSSKVSKRNEQLTCSLLNCRFWLHEFPHMFDLDAKLVRSLEQLQERASTDPDVDTTHIDLANKYGSKRLTCTSLQVCPLKWSFSFVEAPAEEKN